MSTEYSRYFSALSDYNAQDPIDDRDIDGEFDAMVVALNRKVLIKSTAPSTPIEGQTWYDSTNKCLKKYCNGKWVNIETRRQFITPYTKADVGVVGTISEAFITFPQRVKITKFGIMSAASDVVLATTDGFELRTANGTKLATFVATNDYTLGTGKATCQSLETATALATNKPAIFCVASNAGVSGSVYFFVDYQLD